MVDEGQVKPVMVPCPTCRGRGQVDATRCLAVLSTGQPCTQLARSITHPTYLDEFAGGDPDRYPPRFMHYCGRHGNDLRRRLLDQERRDRIRAKQQGKEQT